jgi:hypothetical protein
VRRTRCHRDDVLPTTNIALPTAVVPGREDSPERRDCDGVVAARGERHHVLPLIDLARSGRPVTDGNHPPVAAQSDGVQISGRDSGEVVPVVNGTLSSPIDP